MTKKQAELLRFITDYVESKGYSPSYVEMAEHMGTTSRGRIHALVVALERDGMVTRTPNAARSVRPIERPDALSMTRLDDRARKALSKMQSALTSYDKGDSGPEAAIMVLRSAIPHIKAVL